MGTHEALKALQEMLVLQHTIFDLSFVYIGMLFAGIPTLYKLILITIAFFAARFSALLMNRYVGRPFDIKNRKKKKMHSLRIPRHSILLAFAFSAVIFVISAYLLNFLALALSPLVLALFLIDPISKRHTKQRHFIVGLMMGIGVLGGYIGNAGAFPMQSAPYLLVISILFIGGGFDMVYSVAYTDFDKGHGLYTYASDYGPRKAMRYSLYSHIFAAAFLVLFGISTFSYPVILASALSAIMLLIEHMHINYKDAEKATARFIQYHAFCAILLLLSVAISTAL